MTGNHRWAGLRYPAQLRVSRGSRSALPGTAFFSSHRFMSRRAAIALFVIVDLLVIAGGGYYFRNYFWH